MHLDSEPLDHLGSWAFSIRKSAIKFSLYIGHKVMHPANHPRVLSAVNKVVHFAFAFLLGSILIAPSWGAMTVGGDLGEVFPADPATWTNSTSGYIGRTSGKTGTVIVDLGSDMTCGWGYIGTPPGSNGAVTVTGEGSTWTNTYMLAIGSDTGTGTLTVDNGGLVTAKTLYASLGDLYGNGTITINGGAVLDADLVYDSTHGLTQTLTFGSGGTLNLNVNGTGSLGAGYRGTGSLQIADSQIVSSSVGYLGYKSGSTGTAMVTGSGSKWTNSSLLYVGSSGTGTLSIENGGKVSNTYGYMGFASDSTGTATVSGYDSNWTNSDSLYIGYWKNGTLTLQNGGNVSNTYGYLGYNSGSTGIATVTGNGSKWTNSSDLYIGSSGYGSLTIENGGQVSCISGHLGGNTGNTSMVMVTGSGSKWINSSSLYVSSSSTLTVDNGGLVTAKTLYASHDNLLGNGTINVNGAVLDTDLVFDSTHGLMQALAFGSSGSLNINVNGTCNLGVGYMTSGTLRIADSLTVSSISGYLGYGENAIGSATVHGSGSAWANTANLYVGGAGLGTLTIQAGGLVSSTQGFLGTYYTAIGTASITGAGSTWTNTDILYVGYSGNGTLMVDSDEQVSNYVESTGTNTAPIGSNGYSFSVGDFNACSLTIANGGKVSTRSIWISHELASVNIRVSGNGMLRLGSSTSTGSIFNNGKINFYADAFLAAGAYSPISEYAGRAISWTGTGTYNATGGTWSSTTKSFSTTPAVILLAGTAQAIATGQRLIFIDAATGRRVGASFGTVSGTPTFSASLLDPSLWSGLTLEDGQAVLSAWNFASTLTSGSVLLAFDLGLGASDLKVQRYDGSTWSTYAANDLLYDSNGIASFTVSGFSGYAITGQPLSGDLNGDHVMNNQDIAAFVLALTDPQAFAQAYPLVNALAAGDINGDSALNNQDIAPFVALLTGNGMSLSNSELNELNSIPEPASLGLLLLGGLLTIRKRR